MSILTDEQFYKKRYVEESLIQAVKPILPETEKMTYSLSDTGHEEHVTVLLNGGVILRICVTCDSLLAIAKDVLRGLECGGFHGKDM